MEAKFVSAPFAASNPIHHELVDILSDPAYTDGMIAVAWAKMSGLRLLEPWLRDFAARGRLRFLIGIDDRLASANGLEFILSLGGESVVVYSTTGGIFHPKIYRFSGAHEARVMVGSTNITSGGILHNYEASTSTRLDLTLEPDRAFLADVDRFLATIWGDATSRPLTQKLIDQLKDADIVTVEGRPSSKVPHRKTASKDARILGFGGTTEKLAAPVPKPRPFDGLRDRLGLGRRDRARKPLR